VKIQQRPTKFWTPQLKTALKLQNKARKRIGKTSKRHLDTTGPYLENKIAQKKFRKLFKEAKKNYNIKLVDKACQDQTGADLYRIIKQLEPKLNKRAQHQNMATQEADEETKKIAETFAENFGQKDVKPTDAERAILEEELADIQAKMQKETKPNFTERELEQAIRKANMRSAKGPDGISNKVIKTAYEIPLFREYLLQAINNHIIRDDK